MLPELRRLRKEIDSLISAIRGGPGRISASAPVAERIQDLSFTWSSSIRPGVIAWGVGDEILGLLDGQVSELARLTTSSSPRARYLLLLRRLGLILSRDLIPAVLSVPVGVRLAAVPTVQAIIPEIPSLPNELIPNALYGWIPNIRRFLAQHAYDRNVFVMVSYRSSLAGLVRAVERALVELKLNPILARDHGVTDDLYNPIACLLCCSYGVAIFDRAEARQTHNPNVVYELGMMQFLKRPCVILKHRNLRRMPSDLLTRLYETYSSTEDAVEKINGWWGKLSTQ